MSFIWIVVIVAGAYLAFSAFLFFFQSGYIYYPQHVLSAAVIQPSQDGALTSNAVPQFLAEGTSRYSPVAAQLSQEAGFPAVPISAWCQFTNHECDSGVCFVQASMLLAQSVIYTYAIWTYNALYIWQMYVGMFEDDISEVAWSKYLRKVSAVGELSFNTLCCTTHGL